jgi:hypothetical protein
LGHIQKLYIKQYLSCTEHFMYTGHRIAAPSAVEVHYSIGYLLHCSQSAVLQNAVIQLHLGQESNFPYRGWVKKSTLTLLSLEAISLARVLQSVKISCLLSDFL